MNVQAKDKVKVNYTGTLEDGTVFDSSEGRDPLEFEQGAGQIIAGFEEAVEGMQVGEEKTASMPPEMAYGERIEQLIHKVPVSMFEGKFKPEIGGTLSLQDKDGQQFGAEITAVTDEEVTLDLNHPLAGKTLIFKIQVVDIQRD